MGTVLITGIGESAVTFTLWQLIKFLTLQSLYWQCLICPFVACFLCSHFTKLLMLFSGRGQNQSSAMINIPVES